MARGLSSRASVLVLGGIRLVGDGEELTLAATDMEISLRAALEARVGAPGEVVVPGRLLLDIVRALPGEDAVLEYRPEESVLAITSGGAHYRINTFPAEVFPQLPDVESLILRPVDRAALVETISRVRKSASRDESRPVLTGILVRFEPELVVMAATDSYRLAVKQTPCVSPVGELEAIIPARALEELIRIPAIADEIQLGVHDNHVVFGVAGVWLTSRRIDGQFPNYRQLMPDRFEHELVLPARGDPRRRPPDRPARTAELAAAPPLRGGGAHRLGTDARRRSGRGVAPRPLPRRRTDGDRVQRRVPP